MGAAGVTRRGGAHNSSSAAVVEDKKEPSEARTTKRAKGSSSSMKQEKTSTKHGRATLLSERHGRATLLMLLGAVLLLLGLACVLLVDFGGGLEGLMAVFDLTPPPVGARKRRSKSGRCERGFDTWMESEPGEQGGKWPDAWMGPYWNETRVNFWYNEMTGERTEEEPKNLLVDKGDPDRPHELLARQYRTYKWSIESDWLRFFDNHLNVGPMMGTCAIVHPDGPKGRNTQRTLTTLTLGPWVTSQAPAATGRNAVEDDADAREEAGGCVPKVVGPEHTAVPARSISKTYASAAFMAVSERSQAAGGLGLGAGRPLSLDTTIGQEFGPCGRIENATVRDLLAMKVLDNRNYAIWKFYGHSMDSLGFPAECDARDMDVIRCAREVICPAFEQCLTNGDDDYDTAYETTLNYPQHLPIHKYATAEEKRELEIAYDNYAYTLVDALVKRRTGHPLYYWLKELILRPLGMSQALRCMSDSKVDGPRGRPGCFGTPKLKLACGEPGEPYRECEPFERPTRASEEAASELGIDWPIWRGEQLTVNWISNAVIASPRDMLRFTSMLAGNGTLDGVRVLAPESVDAIFHDWNVCNTFQMGHFGLGVTSCKSDICGARPPMPHDKRPLDENGEAQYVPGEWWGMGGSYGTKFIVLRDVGVTCLHMAMIPAHAVAGDRISARAHFLWRNLGKELREMWPGPGQNSIDAVTRTAKMPHEHEEGEWDMGAEAEAAYEEAAYDSDETVAGLDGPIPADRTEKE